MFRSLGVVVLLTVAVASGCGGSADPSATELTIRIENAWGEKTYHLMCDPPGGDIHDATGLCDRIAANPDAILFTPADNSTCVGGTSTPHIRVTGTYRGRAVATEETDLCEGNLVAQRAWSVLAIPQPP
jgi:hypothetical protein